MVSFLFITVLAFAAPEAPAMKWPQDISLSSKEKLTIFQPQVESLEHNMVTARAAFKMTEGGKESYGSFVMKADTLIDKSTNTVSFKTIKVVDLQIPTGKMDKEKLTNSLEKELNSRPRTVSYNNLLLSLESNTEISKQPAPQLKNEPPQIIFSKMPSLLIMIS
ncbi:MAG: hypothetical protein J7501_01390, partial [Bdellovibrio sp.]|nr:hypothetical protein [Bdellovibrio sp.]